MSDDIPRPHLPPKNLLQRTLSGCQTKRSLLNSLQNLSNEAAVLVWRVHAASPRIHRIRSTSRKQFRTNRSTDLIPYFAQNGRGSERHRLITAGNRRSNLGWRSARGPRRNCSVRSPASHETRIRFGTNIQESTRPGSSIGLFLPQGQKSSSRPANL